MKAQFPDEETKSGEFKRQEDAFREWISNDGSTPYAAEAARYHLYVSLACPWASRTVIVRKLKGLEDAIGMTVVDPVRDDLGWAFRDTSGKIPPGAAFESTDPINGFQFLSEAYKATDPGYKARVTVPVLWDTKTKRIVNNCEDDICRMFNDVFNDFARNKSVDLFPEEIQADHAKLSDFIYDNVNNGVYKAGFTTRQRRYEIACRRVFQALDELEQRLSKSRYLFANRIVEADWRLFCTLVRFDAGLPRPFQMQPAAHHRLSKPAGLPDGLVPAARHRRDGELGSHQAALLHDAHGDQSNPHRSHWSAARPNETARSRKIELRQLPRQQFFIESCASA